MDNKLEVVMRNIDNITPYWRNPRRNDKTVVELSEAIKKFGFNVPIVIDENGVVVKGHARLRSAKMLGMDEIPCIISHENEDIIKADRIADNKIQELSSWDIGKLELEYEKIDKMEFERLFFEPEIELPEYSPTIPNVYVGGAVVSDDGEEVYHATGTSIRQDEQTPLKSENTASNSPYTQEKRANSETMREDGTPRQVRAICPHCGKEAYVEC